MAEFEVVHNMPYYGENETCMDEILSFTAGNKVYPYYGMYDYASNCYLIFSSLANSQVHALHLKCENNESITEFESRLSNAIWEYFGEQCAKITKVSTTYSLMNELRWE